MKREQTVGTQQSIIKRYFAFSSDRLGMGWGWRQNCPHTHPAKVQDKTIILTCDVFFFLIKWVPYWKQSVTSDRRDRNLQREQEKLTSDNPRYKRNMLPARDHDKTVCPSFFHIPQLHLLPHFDKAHIHWRFVLRFRGV